MSVTSGHNQSKHLHRFNKTHGSNPTQEAPSQTKLWKDAGLVMAIMGGQVRGHHALIRRKRARVRAVMRSLHQR